MTRTSSSGSILDVRVVLLEPAFAAHKFAPAARTVLHVASVQVQHAKNHPTIATGADVNMISDIDV